MTKAAIMVIMLGLAACFSSPRKISDDEISIVGYYNLRDDAVAFPERRPLIAKMMADNKVTWDEQHRYDKLTNWENEQQHRINEAKSDIINTTKGNSHEAF